MPKFFKTKISVILASIMREDYLIKWARLFEDIMDAYSLLGSDSAGAGAGAYISFLEAVS